MKKEYKLPEVEIIRFESADVIRTSGDAAAPVKESLYKAGYNVGNTTMTDLMN